MNDTSKPAGDDGSGGSMLEQRVARLEESLREVRSDLKRILELLAKTREDVAEMRGALSRIPTMPQFWAMIVSTWIAGAGIVLLAFRFVEP
jgi:hypothetical protein